MIHLTLPDACLRIAKRHNISGEVFLSILKEIQKENPNIIIESNLRKELKASLDSIKTWYNSEKLNVFNNDGNEILSCVCLLKDLVDFSETVIREKKVIDPEIVIGADSGQNKMIVTLSIFDRSDLERGDVCGYSQAGSRSTLVIAASDGCQENRPNMEKIWSRLKVWELKRKTILSMDGKLANMAMGKHLF